MIAAGAVGIIAAAILTAAPRPPRRHTQGNSEGCTPGFWKNHTTLVVVPRWHATSRPTTTVSSMLGGYTFPASLSQFQTATTMLQALGRVAAVRA